MSKHEMATSFGQQSRAYETGRPEYPADAAAWLLAPVSGAEIVRVVDVGAGTGKLTRALVPLATQVSAIDPDPDMLATLQGSVPGVSTAVGTAEALPLEDSSVDAIVLGQAWHWVEPVAGSRETARVLRSGGVLGLVWNIRDERVPWVARLSAIMQSSNAEVMLRAGGPVIAAPFTRVESAQWEWSRPMTRAQILAMVSSRSYIITASADERARIDAELAELLDEIGAVGDALVPMPYVTHAYRAIRP